VCVDVDTSVYASVENEYVSYIERFGTTRDRGCEPVSKAEITEYANYLLHGCRGLKARDTTPSHK
jgi:hypothetical protein